MKINWINITHAPGLSELLSRELIDEMIVDTEPKQVHRGGCKIIFSPESLVKLWSRSRLASTALLELGNYYVESLDDLYDLALDLPLEETFKKITTIKVDVSGTPPNSIKFSQIPLKIKDAVCDRQREKYFSRPSVDKENPELRLCAHFQGPKMALSVDIFGSAPLHRRGYRIDAGAAPLKENKAAALLEFADLKNSEKKLIDPFCGSGTIILEALCIRSNLRPSLIKSFPIETAMKISDDFGSILEKEILESKELFSKTLDEMKKNHIQFQGSDISKKAIAFSQNNLKHLCTNLSDQEREYLKSMVEFKVQTAESVISKDSLWVTNPPYGERLEGDNQKVVSKIMSEFGSTLKHQCAPATVALIFPKNEHLHKFGFKHSKTLEVPSGPLKTKFWLYEIH